MQYPSDITHGTPLEKYNQKANCTDKIRPADQHSASRIIIARAVYYKCVLIIQESWQQNIEKISDDQRNNLTVGKKVQEEEYL